MAAPSNVAVDQLAARIALTGLKVVRLMAKSREDVASSAESLTLHFQVQCRGSVPFCKYQGLQLLSRTLTQCRRGVLIL